MAYERLSDAKVRGDSLDSFVNGMTTLFSNQMALRNAEDENNFNKAIVDNSLSLEDQLAYRKAQLQRVRDDPAERKRIRAEITTLNARVQQQKYTEEYQSKLADNAAGISSIDTTISWLNDQLDSVSDPDTRAAISKAITDNETKKFNLVQTLLSNQTDYAVKDKTDSILDTQIGRVTGAKNQALLAGDQTLASSLDLQLQALTKAKYENGIQKDINNFAASTVTGYASATQLLDAYNQKLTAAAPTGPVKIGDVTYASPQEFWKFKRDSYLADTSSSGFFARFNDEQNTNLKVKNSQNSLTQNDLSSASSAYNGLTTRPELANYAYLINANKQDSLQTGANLLAQNVLNSYNSTYDLNSAVSSLNSLKSMGVNVDDAFNKIITTATGIKSNQVGNVIQNAQTLMLNDPNLTPSDAVTKAIAQGSAGVLSPSQILTKTPEEIAKETVAGAKNSAFTSDTRTTTPAPPTPSNITPTPPPPVVPTPTPANQNSSVPASTTPKPTIMLNKQLDFGMTDPQVRELQKFLNSQGFAVATTGAGSAGNETDYFGALTQSALQKFQAAKGIVSTGDAATTGYGRLGPQTLTAIQKLLGQ